MYVNYVSVFNNLNCNSSYAAVIDTKEDSSWSHCNGLDVPWKWFLDFGFGF